LTGLSTFLIVGISVVCALAILIAGRFLIIFADVLAHKTKMGHAVVGTLFLAIITSLPEITATVTAMHLDNASLAVNNLIGGIVMQTFILALADAFCAKKPITSHRFPPLVMILALFLILQLAVATSGFAVGEFVVFRGFGIWALCLFLIYIALLIVMHRMPGVSDNLSYSPRGEKQRQWVMRSNVWFFSFAFLFLAAVALFAGSVVTTGIDVLSVRLGINAGFLGATVLALITSLPEISTTFYAVRMGGNTLAFTNIFGSNVLMMALIFLADVLSPTPVIAQLKMQPLFLCGMAVIVTLCYVFGMVRKCKRKLFGMGRDSFAVICVTIICYFLLYFVT
jgi:cation:H+ antiporter